MESCMLSPAMLTATKRSVTWGAPNEVYFLQFVGTPNFNARVILLRQRLASLPFLLLGKTLSFPSTPTSWSLCGQSTLCLFMNYLESKSYSNEAGDILSSGAELTDEPVASANFWHSRGCARWVVYIGTIDRSNFGPTRSQTKQNSIILFCQLVCRDCWGQRWMGVSHAPRDGISERGSSHLQQLMWGLLGCRFPRNLKCSKRPIVATTLSRRHCSWLWYWMNARA
jgi:hypothetical protein